MKSLHSLLGRLTKPIGKWWNMVQLKWIGVIFIVEISDRVLLVILTIFSLRTVLVVWFIDIVELSGRQRVCWNMGQRLVFWAKALSEYFRHVKAWVVLGWFFMVMRFEMRWDCPLWFLINFSCERKVLWWSLSEFLNFL